MRLLSIFRRPGWRGVWLGLLCALLAWVCSRDALLGGLEEWFQDGFVALRGRRATYAPVVLVELDETSLRDLGRPTPYISGDLAEVVTFLKDQGAASIGLDMLVPEALAGSREFAEGQGLQGAIRLGEAIQTAGNVALAKRKLSGDELRAEDRAAAAEDPEREWLLPLPQWRLKAFIDPSPTDLGFIDLTEDADHYVRRQLLYARQEHPRGDRAHMHFALALFAVATHRADKVRWNGGALYVGDERIALDDEALLRINFVGPPGSVPRLRFGDVLKAARGKQALPVRVAGAVAIVGVTARSQQDYHITPYANNYARYLSGSGSGLMAGSEVHANIVATLLDREYVRTAPWPVSLGLLLGVGAVLGRAFARLSLGWGLALAFGQHWLWKGLCYASFTYLHLRLEVVSMLVLGGVLYAVTLAHRWRVMRRMLGVVKSEDIARLLENDPGQLDLRGEERIVTVLFADVRDFTTFSEGHAARDVVKLLNTYFGAIVPLIEAHGGTLNQYMGDGIMVLFGAPSACPDHAARAVRTAVAIVRRVHELRETWVGLDSPGMRIGVGVHTGRVIVGTVGSPRRLDYTAIGDTVNAAARIEAANKEFGTEILISAETYRDLTAQERRELGCEAEGRPAAVKGKKQQLLLHAVTAPQEGPAPATAVSASPR